MWRKRKPTNAPRQASILSNGRFAAGSLMLCDGWRAGMAQFAEAGAETEAGDALVEVDAGAAGLQTSQEAEQAAGKEQALLELGDLVCGQLAPAGGDGGVGAEAVEKELDFA